MVVLLGFSVLNCSRQEPGAIRIGAVLPLSGDVAVYGNNTKEGIELALDEINRKGDVKGIKLEVIYEDSKAQPQTGVVAFQKLISVNKVAVVIDNSVSSVALAMVPIASRDSVVIVSTGSTNPKLSGSSPFFFRIWNSDALEGKWTARFAADSLQIKTLSILYVNNDYGKGLEEVFRKQFENAGGTILSSESFEQGASNFRTALLKAKVKKAKAVYIVAYPKEIGVLLKQMKELGLKAKRLGTVTMEDPQIITIAGEASEGVIYPFPMEPNKNDTVVASFERKFEEKYGKQPGITADVGYDALKMIWLAIGTSSRVSGEEIRTGLRRIKAYHGASGIMEFDESGDVNKPMNMKTIKDGKFVRMKGVPDD
jgi:branched-chain amino acid transport system substrate-binding protein